MGFLKWIRFAAGILSVVILGGRVAGAQAGDDSPGGHPPLTIAIVRDGPSFILDQMIEKVKGETTALLRSKREVTFLEEPDFNANWYPGGARLALKRALDDERVDLVLLQGFFSLEEAARGNVELTKPCVGAYVQDPRIVAPFIQNGRSTIKNLAVVVSDISLFQDLKTFHDLVGFNQVHYAATDAYVEDMKGGPVPEVLNRLDNELGVSHGFIPVGPTAAESLNNIPPDTEAIFFFPPMRFPDQQELDAFITGVNAKGIPTYAMSGESGVAQGFLFGTMPDMRTQLARRAALAVEELANGKAATSINALFKVDRELYVNVVTASAIGFDLPTDMLFDAVLIGGSAPEVDAEPLDLNKAVELAKQANFELRRQRQDTKAVYEARRQAFSSMLPQVGAVYQFERVNDATARASLGGVPRRSQSVGVGVSQMIYDDDIVTGYRIAEQDYEAAEFFEQSIESDVVQRAAVAYLRYLSAKSILAIARENLDVTRTNLSLARVRLDVGTAGPEEVFRFESAEASDRASVALAESQANTSLTALNRVLGLDELSSTWDAENIGLSSDAFDVTSRRVVELITSQARADRFRIFSLQFAMAHAPELEVNDRTLAARELDYGRAQRSFVVPDVGVNFDYLYTFDEDIVNTPQAAFAGGNRPDDEWIVTVEASIPIFEGGNRVFDLLRQKARVRSEEFNRQVTRQIVEQRVYDALYSLSASYNDIRFSRIAADRAQKNLDIVTEKYRVGRVNIVDLLDAQNEAFVQKQNETLATYGFLEDLVDYMRAINWFEFLASPGEQEDWIEDVRRFVEPADARPGR